MKKDETKKPTEAEVMGELDAAMAKLDDAARKRALDWLRAKYVANSQLPDLNEITKALQRPWVGVGGVTKLCDLTTMVFC